MAIYQTIVDVSTTSTYSSISTPSVTIEFERPRIIKLYNLSSSVIGPEISVSLDGSETHAVLKAGNLSAYVELQLPGSHKIWAKNSTLAVSTGVRLEVIAFDSSI